MDLQISDDVRQVWKIYREKLNFASLGVTGDVTGQVKFKMFNNLAYLVLSCTTTASNGNNPIKKKWIVSGTLFQYHLKLSVSIFKVKVLQDYEVKERSDGKFRVWVM